MVRLSWLIPLKPFCREFEPRQPQLQLVKTARRFHTHLYPKLYPSRTEKCAMTRIMPNFGGAKSFETNDA